VNSWRGLIRKEWTFMWPIVFLLILVNSIIVFVDGSHTDQANYLDSISLWFFLHMFLGVIVLLYALGEEMKYADIWLHSPESVIKLVGAKVVIVLFAVTCSLVLCGMLLGVLYFVSGGPVSVFGATLFFSVALAILLNSIYVMAIGLFFWSVYQVVRSHINRFWSRSVTLVLFFIGVYLVEKFQGMELFRMIKNFGPVNLPDVTFYKVENSFMFTGIAHEGVVFTVGGLLLYCIVTVVMIIAGSILFEKKVRY
jgi:hypothetical protein